MLIAVLCCGLSTRGGTSKRPRRQLPLARPAPHLTGSFCTCSRWPDAQRSCGGPWQRVLSTWGTVMWTYTGGGGLPSLEPVFSVRARGRAVPADSAPASCEARCQAAYPAAGRGRQPCTGARSCALPPPGPGAWGQGHGEDTRTFRLTRHSLEASPRARRASGPDAFVLSGRGPRYPARLRGTLIFSAGHRTGAAASEADELLGPRLVVLSVSRGDANAIRVPGTTEVGRQGEGGGRDPAVSRDEVSRAVAGPAPHTEGRLPSGGPMGVGDGGCPGCGQAGPKRPLPSGIAVPGVRRAGISQPEATWAPPEQDLAGSRCPSLASEARGADFSPVLAPVPGD